MYILRYLVCLSPLLISLKKGSTSNFGTGTIKRIPDESDYGIKSKWIDLKKNILVSLILKFRERRFFVYFFHGLYFGTDSFVLYMFPSFFHLPSQHCIHNFEAGDNNIVIKKIIIPLMLVLYGVSDSS